MRRPIHEWMQRSRSATPCAGAGAENGVASAPAIVLENEILREESIRYTVQLLVAERCSRASAAGLLNHVPTEYARQMLAIQVIEEARHVEMFTGRLAALGVEEAELDDVIRKYAHPDLLGIADKILDEVREGDYVVGIVAQNVILDEVLLTVYEMLESTVSAFDPAFSAQLRRLLADEASHSSFGEDELRKLLVRNPDKKSEIARIHREIGSLLLHTFDEALLDNPMMEEFRRLRALHRLDEESPMAWRGIDLFETDGDGLESALVALVSTRVADKLARLGVRVGNRRGASVPG